VGPIFTFGSDILAARRLPDLRAGLQHHEPQVVPGQVPGRGQPGLAAADHHIQRLIVRPGSGQSVVGRGPSTECLVVSLSGIAMGLPLPEPSASPGPYPASDETGTLPGCRQAR
jgi:hypothetical protein